MPLAAPTSSSEELGGTSRPSLSRMRVKFRPRPSSSWLYSSSARAE
ncbi:MAG: hypothetical protein PHX05_04335 [Acidobacteriota bacterium]|nr:hypothetical protein [Acidobacteriota bacterium]